MNSSQIFDLVVVGTLLFCAWKGAARGLVSQAAWVVALILCFKFSGELAPVVEPTIAVEQPLKKWIAMAIVYLGLCLLSFVAASMLNTWLERTRLKDFDRHLGALLGFIKGVVVCMTVMFFALTLSESARTVVSGSRSGYLAAVILYHLDPLIPLIPEGAKDTVNVVRERFHKELNSADPLQGATRTPGERFDDDWAPSDRQEAEPSPSGSSGFHWQDLLTGGNSRDDTSSPSSVRPAASTEPSLQDVLKSLPAEMRNEITSRMMDSIRNATAEQKQRLIDDLKNALPESTSAVLDDFVASGVGSGEGSRTPSTPGQPAPLSRSNAALLDQIAGIYGDRQQIVSRTRQFLSGLPEQVQRQVLEDWHADVMLLQNDPDPSTDVNTRLDERIVRQLGRSGIALDRLDRELRTRLSQSTR